MKKMTISITAILLLLATLLTLQAGAQWTAGLKAGASISNFDEKSEHNLRSKTGGVFGGFAQYRFQPHVSVQGEILFSMQGGTSYEFENGFIVDMRYVKGLSDITIQDEGIRNNSIQLTLGYRLGRRK